jgi:hypothetical protein
MLFLVENELQLGISTLYVVPVAAWYLPSGWTLRVSPGFGLNDNSHQFLMRWGVSREFSGFAEMPSHFFGEQSEVELHRAYESSRKGAREGKSVRKRVRFGPGGWKAFRAALCGVPRDEGGRGKKRPQSHARRSSASYARCAFGGVVTNGIVWHARMVQAPRARTVADCRVPEIIQNFARFRAAGWIRMKLRR